MSAKEDLQWRIRTRIANGCSTRIWEDQRIPNQSQGKPITAKPADCQVHKVADLIEDYRWNRNLIFKTFNEKDPENILKIPISITGREDNTFWMRNQNGEYTVQSGYKSIMAKKEQEGSERMQGAETSCNQRLILTRNITTWWTALSEAKHRVQGMEHIALTTYILWQIWKCRNNREFNNKVQEPMQVINKAWNAWMEFNNGVKEARKCSISKTTVPPQMNGQEVRQNLENRPRGMHIRIATSWNKETKFIGYGIIAANSRGQDVIGWKMRERASESQLQQRAEGVKWALIKAAEQRWRLVCIEVPGKDLLQQIQGSKTANMWIATLINDIRELSTMFYKCSFCLEKYNRNDLSCLFSAQALSNYHDLEWVNPNLLY
ncbi:uncharacterized protein LOC113774101 [Coffea eugenioides]|uniref:uncharacterized protein LOC113774101 n=1 Tax=Coffea eugenioides TaxID=49369 RepID=UPI000F61337C|nr:uncharacterized protein LOC113774101 [Coffea eugenioides]